LTCDTSIGVVRSNPTGTPIHQNNGSKKTFFAAINPRKIKGLLRWGRLWEVATNFILAKAKLTQKKRKFGRFSQTAPHRNNPNRLT
jgi:hypothetical protein